jgi:predicted RNA-binding Zn-ribbon protein involved in translation (DUF1610 family)
MIKMMEQIDVTLKVKGDTKDDLDTVKDYPGQTYNDLLKGLVRIKKTAITCDLKSADEDWKNHKKMETFFVCPKCSTQQHGLFLHRLHSVICDFLEYGDSEDRIRSVLFNLNLESQSSEFVNLYLVKLKETKKKWIQSHRESPIAIEPAEFSALGIENIDVAFCVNCKEGFPLNQWKEIKIEVLAYKCPKCGSDVIDVPENYTISNSVLACSDCGYFFDRVWEIFNHIPWKFPTIDHVGYDRKHKALTIQPYSCDPNLLVKLIVTAQALDYNVDIRGRSEHDPNCLTIGLYRNDKLLE